MKFALIAFAYSLDTDMGTAAGPGALLEAGLEDCLAVLDLPASLARHLVSLKLFFRYLQLEGVLQENLAELLGSQKLWQRVPKVLSPEQVDQLLERCDKLSRKITTFSQAIKR